MSNRDKFPQVVCAWATGAEFLAGCKELPPHGRTFLCRAETGREPPAAEIDAVFSVLVRFADRNAEFHVHGRVVERVTRDAGRDVGAGLRFAFVPEEKDRQELVFACAEGESIPYLRRKSIRTPCDLPVELTRADGTTDPSRLVNISERGCYMAFTALSTDDRIELAITLPGQRRPMRIRGRVTGVNGGPERGVGIEFLFESVKQREELAAEVALVRGGRG